MTNEEINLKMAEIEGWGFTDGGRTAYGWHWARCVDTPTGKTMERFHGENPPPYATDWQWCGPLVEKYRVHIEPISGGMWEATLETTLPGYGEIADTPQRAICLAVIAAQPTPATLPPEAPVHDNDRS